MTSQCLKCKVSGTLIVQREREGGKLECTNPDCKYIYTDDETNKAFGLIHIGDQAKPSFENGGENWKKFPSWYCLKLFDTYEERVAHDKKWHKDGEIQLGMFPVGFTPDGTTITCGD